MKAMLSCCAIVLTSTAATAAPKPPRTAPVTVPFYAEADIGGVVDILTHGPVTLYLSVSTVRRRSACGRPSTVRWSARSQAICSARPAPMRWR
jgi:hypothetical protein